MGRAGPGALTYAHEKKMIWQTNPLKSDCMHSDLADSFLTSEQKEEEEEEEEKEEKSQTFTNARKMTSHLQEKSVLFFSTDFQASTWTSQGHVYIRST